MWQDSTKQQEKEIFIHIKYKQFEILFPYQLNSISAIIQQVLFYSKGTFGIKNNTKIYSNVGLLETIKKNYIYIHILFEILPLYCAFISPISPQFNNRQIVVTIFRQNGKNHVIQIRLTWNNTFKTCSKYINKMHQPWSSCSFIELYMLRKWTKSCFPYIKMHKKWSIGWNSSPDSPLRVPKWQKSYNHLRVKLHLVSFLLLS